MKNDVQLYEDLQSILMAINKLQDLVEDTVMETGSEAYVAELAIYQYVKTGSGGDALEVAADDLSRRFARKSGLTQTDSGAKSTKA